VDQKLVFSWKSTNLLLRKYLDYYRYENFWIDEIAKVNELWTWTM